MSTRYRTRLAVSALVALLASSTALAQGLAGQAAKVSQLYEDALSRYERKDFKGAVIQLKNAVSLDKATLQVTLLMGKALLADGQAVPAEVALSDALNLGVARTEVVVPLASAIVMQGRQQSLLQDSRFEVAGLPPSTAAALHVLRAGALSDVGEPKRALLELASARQLQPDSPASWVTEVQVRIRAGELDIARSAAERALALDGTSAEAFHVRGQVEHAAGKLIEAQRWYDRSISADPAQVEARVARAGLLLDLGRIDAALEDISAALKMSATDPRASYLKAVILERQGQSAAARGAFNAVTAVLDPVPQERLRYRPQLLMLGGLAHYSLQEPEKALPYLDQLHRLHPAGPSSKILARILMQTKNEVRATEVLEGYLRHVPGDADAVVLLAGTHMSQGRFARAARLSKDALAGAANSVELRSIYGLSLMGDGQYEQAVLELERVIKSNPKRVEAGSALVTLYLESGQPSQALRVAQRLSQALPRQPNLYVLLGDAQAANQQPGLARKSYERALALHAGTQAELGLARLDLGIGATAAALQRIDSVLRREPDQVQALALLAGIQERQGRQAEAQRLYERADEVSGPNSTTAGLALVNYHLRQGKAESAREALSRVSAKAPDAVQTLLAATQVHLALGQIKEAKSLASRASTRAGESVSALLRVAQLQLDAGHSEGAAHSLDKALAKRAGDPVLEALRAEAALRSGDTAQAESRARRLVSLAPKAGVGEALLGDTAMATNRPLQAVMHYKAAYRIEPTQDNLLRLSQALAEQDPHEGIRLLRAHLRKHPAAHAARRALADSEARVKSYAAARHEYELLDRDAAPDAEVLNNLAQVLILQRDPGALAVAERALRLKPNAAHILGTTGWASHLAGQHERALALLRDARLRAPNSAGTRYYLGAALAKAGRIAEAKVELKAALELNPRFEHADEAKRQLAALP